MLERSNPMRPDPRFAVEDIDCANVASGVYDRESAPPSQMGASW
jgi:hypothetical protein